MRSGHALRQYRTSHSSTGQGGSTRYASTGHHVLSRSHTSKHLSRLWSSDRFMVQPSFTSHLAAYALLVRAAHPIPGSTICLREHVSTAALGQYRTSPSACSVIRCASTGHCVGTYRLFSILLAFVRHDWYSTTRAVSTGHRVARA
eukprot:3028609-Rhodomonas_salina.2